MLTVLRREFKNWKFMLWIVFISMALSGVTVIFYRQPSRHEMAIGWVNGKKIPLLAYQRSMTEMNERLNNIRQYARSYGMDPNAFISMMLGGATPEEFAFEQVVKDALIGDVEKSFNIQLDSEWFKDHLIEAIPQGLVDPATGKLDKKAYVSYLARMGSNPVEFEQEKENEIKRTFATSLISGGAYWTNFEINELVNQEADKKQFKIAVFENDLFAKQVEKAGVADADIKDFYTKHKESYRVPEKRSAVYWELAPEKYAADIDVDEQAIVHFYEKNKTSSFRESPKVKVRRILLANSTEGKKAAEELREKASQDPDSFAQLAKANSLDKKTASNGGLVDFFARNTYHQAFERAAFALQEANQISPVVKTDNGYEVIQLVERLKATEKPLSEVHGQIEKMLKSKKALNTLRSDLEALVRSAKQDKDVVDTFIQEHALTGKEQKTALVTEGSGSSKFDQELHKRLFAGHRKEGSIGYFVDGEKYYLYSIASVQASMVPPLDQIKDKVKQNLINKKAADLIQSFMQSSKKELLDQATTLDALVSKHGGRIITTELETKAGVKGLQETGLSGAALFVLQDSKHVLAVDTDHGCALAQLVKKEDGTPGQKKAAARRLIRQEGEKHKQLVLAAFIASLHKNATIEPNSALLKSSNLNEKE